MSATQRGFERVQWTPDLISKAAKLWNNNKSAAEIAEALGGGVSRSAVIGKANRHKDIFKPRRPGDIVRPNKNRPQRRAANQNAPDLDRDPTWAKRTFVPAVSIEPPSRQEVEAMMTDWVSRNGEPRRFPQGFSGEWFNLRNKMADLGWDLRKEGSWYTISRIGSGGRAKRLGREDILRRIDEVLVTNGLQPFIKRQILEAAE